jgi:hypothetical protein|tara:strand:+ start:1682 stop:2038 length:357 start_codon:yes stop_codon:yes gene_type:complete
MSLKRWFKEEWIDIKTGKPCGRQKGEKRKGYPACRPSKRVSKETPTTAGELGEKGRKSFKRRKKGPKRTESETGSPSEDKFLAKHMRMEYSKKPKMTDDERKKALAIGYKKFENRKKK